MGVKSRASSEYQRSFKSKYPCFTTTYEKNFDYRVQRRSTEHDHQVDPFLWDSSSSGSNSEVGSCTDLLRKPVPIHRLKHEKFNKAHQDRLNHLKEQLEKNLHISESNGQLCIESRATCMQHEETQTENLSTVSEGDTLTHDKETQHEEPRQPDEISVKELSTSKRPRKPVLSTGVPTHTVARPCRVKSAIKPRPASVPIVQSELVQKAPFLPYGFKDRETMTGSKKTYNIRASADIYPSALLAQKRREAAIHHREEQAKSASLSDKRKKALFNEFNEKVRRDTAQWATEYRSHYAGYDQDVYQRSSSARPASRYHDAAFFGATW